MSTEVYESALIAAPINKVWAAIRPLDFKFWDAVKSVELENKADPSEVGGVRKVTYKDGAVQSIKLTELSDAKTALSYEIVGAVPALTVLSAVHTVRLFRVTTHDQTMVEWVSDFSKEADANFLADAALKKADFFKALTKALVQKRKNWMPLEGNPGLMAKYCKNLGVNMTGIVEFQDVLSLEPDALSWVSAPQLALLLMFPINAASEAHRKAEEKLIETKGQHVSPQVYHLKQTVGNACGTVGIIHAVANNQKLLPLEKGKFFQKFLEQTAKMDSTQRAAALEANTDIEVAHQSTAKDPEAKSNANAKFNDDIHFNCFVCVDGGLYELDGRKRYPIYHGPTKPETLLKDAVKVIKDFMGRASGDSRFSIIALAPPSPFGD